MLRIILTILVVIGHASYYTIKIKFGGIQYNQLMQDMMVGDTTFHRVATYLTDWIYVFHMPAYFCLSGVVFSMELKRKRYPSVWTLIVMKAKRLLAPMLFVWLVWNIPIKMLAGYYAGMNHPLLSAVMQIAFPNAVYLWFLEALFCCFVMDYIIIKGTSNNYQLIHL
ncbi:acyltransferase family protein [Lactococcus petauri]|uniref:acyltransferase family protein n=1 Tax=Lactococcus petauri TaxID=1940789 RepID=UPI00311AC99C